MYIQTLFQSFISFFLIVFLAVDSCLCGNNVGIAAEINFTLIGLSVYMSWFCKYNDLQKYLSSKWSEQIKTIHGKLLLSLLIATKQLLYVDL